VETSDELERLRALVGPSEKSYDDLRLDRDESVRVARETLAEMGTLRGDIFDLRVQVARARQYEEYRQVAAAMTPAERAMYRTRRRWAISIRPRLSILVQRLDRAIGR